MTRSIYDPTGDDAGRGREGFLGPQARQASKMPPNLADRKATDEESPHASDPSSPESHDDAHHEPMDDADPVSPPSPAPREP